MGRANARPPCEVRRPMMYEWPEFPDDPYEDAPGG